MAQLGVTTPVFETEWSIEPVDRTFIVNSVTRDPRGVHHLTFTPLPAPSRGRTATPIF